MAVDASAAVTPNIARHIQLHRTDSGVTLTIDGQPFPYSIGADVAAFWGDDGIGAVQITVHAERLELIDAERDTDAPESAPVDVPPGIAQLLATAAKHFIGIRFHEDDPNRTAIEYEAQRLGLETTPSRTVEFRRIEGVGARGN